MPLVVCFVFLSKCGGLLHPRSHMNHLTLKSYPVGWRSTKSLMTRRENKRVGSFQSPEGAELRGNVGCMCCEVCVKHPALQQRPTLICKSTGDLPHPYVLSTIIIMIFIIIIILIIMHSARTGITSEHWEMSQK